MFTNGVVKAQVSRLEGSVHADQYGLLIPEMDLIRKGDVLDPDEILKLFSPEYLLLDYVIYFCYRRERECVFAVNAIRSHSLFLMSKAYVLLCRKTGGGRY